jgi:translation initiation factor 5B
MIQKQFRQGKVVFPCRLSIFPEYIFMKGGNDDLLIGVKVLDGTLYRGTPLTCNGLNIGRVLNIEKNKQSMEIAKKGDEVCIRIENKNKYVFGASPKGHFDESSSVVSTLTRTSIDTLKEHYKEHMTNDDWALVVFIMKKLNIQMKKANN